jgi:predicted ester cyclase
MVKVKAIHIHQIVEGRIAVLWEEFDMFGLRQQLGLTPEST